MKFRSYIQEFSYPASTISYDCWGPHNNSTCWAVTPAIDSLCSVNEWGAVPKAHESCSFGSRAASKFYCHAHDEDRKPQTLIPTLNPKP